MDVAETPSLRHRLLQGAAGFVALVGLYVLGDGPAVYLSVKLPKSEHFLGKLYDPLGLVVEDTPLQQPLYEYELWWWKLAGDKSAR